ncbi:hypothetical protein [Comamonas terrigena]|uniref:hypothetical protein n=1 Tax=Comamonas terrigena TaxID=32013 RepID=UPI002352F36A|nr:hypothetical protein [Comamonas terrigena]
MIPTNVLDRLFTRLAATYGAAWDRSLGSAPIADVKTVWSHELAGFAPRLEDIAWALEHLPEKCPNVLEFRALCRRAPAPEFKLIEAPRANPERVAQLAQQVRDVVQSTAEKDPKGWARKLQQQHEAGKKLGAHQIRAYRQALGLEGRQSWQ